MRLQFELILKRLSKSDNLTIYKNEQYYLYRNVPKERALEIVNHQYFYKVSQEGNAIVIVSQHKKQYSDGFRGNGWMVESIIENGEIIGWRDRWRKQ